jgi:predicted regulator of Ras-like GTPase activity (Roadblock/LC7/MglB family)
MTTDLLLWLLSLSEAALFFAGGVLFAAYRAARAETAAHAEEQRVYQPTLASGDVLRKILARETRNGGMAGAVIADDLGLVVAGQGELCEALAAYGAVLAGVGAKTRELLPFEQLRKVTVQDDRTTLTVRPIATADDHFTLVTLSSAQQVVPAHANASLER